MTVKIKLAAYVILAVLALWFGRGFYANFQKIGQVDSDSSAKVTSQETVPTSQAAPTSVTTNTGDLSTNTLTATNDIAASNDFTATNNVADTNVAKLAAPTNATALAAKKKEKTATPAAASAVVPETRQGRPLGYLAAFVAALIGLGLLAAYDVTQFLGARTVDLLFDDQGPGARDPEYEKAEAVWANGKPLEAVQMMRDYLKTHTREQYVALRIAEIYEKDLRNFVAASLEYEEILKKRLSDERWGWAAIHLCNLYSKMGQPDKMKALLERIAHEYPNTGAAKKARRNLGLAEPEEAPAPEVKSKAAVEEVSENGESVFDLDEAIASSEEEEAPAPPPEAKPKAKPAAEPAKSNLPQGFRPK